jgi:hypothetical protein
MTMTTELSITTLRLAVRALERYRNRMAEVGSIGWYKNPQVTRQEIERVDNALAEINGAIELLEN